MCGIVGATSKKNITHQLISGLKKLEYRGYDSSGLAIIDANREIQRLRLVGKVLELDKALTQHPIEGFTGIAHTRWATHGVPSEKNAHPFVSHDAFALVHNGIIENHQEIRNQLTQEGYQFLSDTDSETIVHLIHKYYLIKKDLIAAVRAATSELKGAYALGIIAKDFPNQCIAVRQGSALVIGKGKNENFIASDPLALLSFTKDFIYLEDNDIALITPSSIEIFGIDGKPAHRDQHKITFANGSTEKGKYRHFMKKEIMEQANAVNDCLEGRISKEELSPAIFGPTAETTFAQVKHIQLVACGSSYHAATVARYWIEELANLPCSVEVASEFRYRKIAKPAESLFVVISQSGETADTLAALRLAKTLGYLATLGICNVPESTIMRESQLHFLTYAGVEIGVASTKAFLTQLVALFLLTLALSKNKCPDKERKALITELTALPEYIELILQHDNEISQWAKTFIPKQHALFLGRGMLYPIALEGALKMKEIAYIHAEAYPSGELKHGPLALIDANMPVITSAPGNYLLEKNLSNLQEVHTRGGKLYIFTDDAKHFSEAAFADANLIVLPPILPLLAPILYTVPLQLLAYHVAVMKGTDVDQPRNLAKSVTVE